MIYMRHNIMMAVIPSVLLGSGLTATARNHAWGEDWGSYGGYPRAGPGAYSLGYSGGISDAVYDHDNSLAYNPVGNCLPCHSQIYWNGFHHGYDTQWNTYQSTQQTVNNYVTVKAHKRLIIRF